MAAARPLPLFDDPPNAQGYGDANDHVDSGALIPWEKADGTAAGHVALLGIRTIILCLVMCTGRVISDGALVEPCFFMSSCSRLLVFLSACLLVFSSSRLSLPFLFVAQYRGLCFPWPSTQEPQDNPS